MDKRDRAQLFRSRITEAMASAENSKSALARATGADRTTIGHLLNGQSPRLPNAHLAAEIAAHLGVSCDWLLGLSDRPERPGDILAAALDMADAKRTTADDKILDWHREAAGYKIRHVPATLPDMLKTEAMLAWEYRSHLGKSPGQAIAAMRATQEVLLSGQSDYEIAVPLHEVTALAEGAGYYAGLAPDIRAEQIDTLARISAEAYPAIRLTLFDSHTLYSAPVTIFGPRLAVLYVGQLYLAFRSGERVRALTAHFDDLVREAAIGARELPRFLGGLTIA